MRTLPYIITIDTTKAYTCHSKIMILLSMAQ